MFVQFLNAFKIPDIDPFTMAIIQEVTRWVSANPISIGLVVLALLWMKKKAVESTRIANNKIITWLIDFLIGLFTFKWLTAIASRRICPPDEQKKEPPGMSPGGS